MACLTVVSSLICATQLWGQQIKMSSAILFLLVSLGTVCLSKQNAIQDSNDVISYISKNFVIKVHTVHQQTAYTVEKFGQIINRVHLNEDFGKNLSKTEIDNGFVLHGLGRDIEFKVVDDTKDFSLVQVSTILRSDQEEVHCIDLETGKVNWFGGPQISFQYWPVEKLRLEDYSYVPKHENNVGVAERYWLNSRGGFIYVSDKVPLFIDQKVNGDTLCLKAKNKLPYNTRRAQFTLSYHLGAGRDAKIAQRHAVEMFLKQPSGVPDRRMVKHPIWSTWARYKKNINETKVELFASEIEKYGFNNSQLEIDDDWEVCYGALTFRDSKFPNIRKQTDGLRARGFRVTLWVHPFINKGCEPWYSEARNKGYLVTNHEGNPDTEWWNSGKRGAAYIDFTNPEASKWFTDRLEKLQEDAGIDSYKFDAGETSWSPMDKKLNAAPDDHPLEITRAYVRAVSQFGATIEIRTGQGTQDLPVFMRLIDKDTEWTFNNGLSTVITSLLQMNMVGYGFILPDMIGGNGYNHPPSEELFIRWLQANVFMPTLQYSYAPWDYSDRAIEICRKFTDLHAHYSSEIMKAFEAAVKRGEPVNPPIWWLDPYDSVALSIYDEFLLGDRILAAPVVKQGANSRNVYLPRGKWYDPNQNKTYAGPIQLNDYPAPITVLPYFIRK